MNNTVSSDMFADYIQKYVIPMTGYMCMCYTRVCILNKTTLNNIYFKNMYNNEYLMPLKRLYCLLTNKIGYEIPSKI